MTTSTLTKSNTQYVKDLYEKNSEMRDLIDEYSQILDSLNPHKIYTQYISTEEFNGYSLWYKVGRRYTEIFCMTSYFGWSYGNPKNRCRRMGVSFQCFPTDKDGYWFVLDDEPLTKKEVTGYGCSPEKLVLNNSGMEVS